MFSRYSIIAKEVAIYCKLGWPIHPLNNKRPILNDWQIKATTNPETFMQWINKYPLANVGVLTGLASNLLVLDVDGMEGIRSLEGLDLPQSPMVVTARGYHYYFKFPKKLINVSTTRSGLLPGIDTRGQGGFITAPPSIHETGYEYHWGIPLIDDLPVAPEWLTQKLTPVVKSVRTVPICISEKLSHYVLKALKNESAAVNMAPKGTRNFRLNQAAFSMGTLVAAGVISIETVAEALAAAASNAGLGQAEIERTLCSGLSAGMKSPREVSHG